ncbi:hypothetical protein PSACC_00214 [Paramicrosporidium saccamoebae]|uniref:Metallo-beta-lactamase domain-containing protein n=1 Tax=Paramicrosporidium saccamoebae TaxID=1246581 RepID=A0A2H9TQC5_9FUNG|nr:hypothetical protein PSACC_00698 [Paramicrosporidium saccamoebae]PJF19968.1 hypothetical protein PSACC_00214 [Paramicrosporidium saccamoebae]
MGRTEVIIRPMEGIPDIDIVDIPTSTMGVVEELLLVGAGTSSSVPSVACLAMDSDAACKVCLDAAGRLERSAEYTRKHGGPPAHLTGATRNRRTNPSAVLRYRHSDGTLHSILIDCGKTFYTNTERMLRAGVRVLDGVLLTHGHADAILGLDDLRHWAGHFPSIQETVNVYCDADTFEVVKKAFPYLVDRRLATGGGEVPALMFHTIESGVLATIGELEVMPVRLLHGCHSDGKDYFANGFRVGGLSYFSDISGVPKESQQLVMGSPTEVLIVDCLLENKSYLSHYCWPQTEPFIKELDPKTSVLVGMSHRIDYYGFQHRLDKERGIEITDGVIGKLKYIPGRVLVGFDGMLLRFIH